MTHPIQVRQCHRFIIRCLPVRPCIALVLLSLVNAFWGVSPLFSMERHVGNWENASAGIQLMLDNAGNYRWQDASGTFDGKYRLENKSLTFYGYQQSITYDCRFKDKTLVLSDASGNSLVLTLAGIAGDEGVQGGTGQALPAGGGPPGSDAYFLHFLETYETLSPDAVLEAYPKLHQDHRLLIETSQALGSRIFLIMCQAGQGSHIRFGGLDCNALAMQYQQALQFGVDPRQNAELERMQLVTVQKCTMGIIDKASCGMYMGNLQSTNDAMNETSETIIDNMGSTGCTQYYDQNGTYLGCW